MPDEHATDQTKKLPNRRSVRLTGHDYGQAGFYFVTICAADKRCIFGRVERDRVQLSAIGEIIDRCLTNIPMHMPGVNIDTYVIMPNHIHAIIQIVEPNAPTSLSSIIGSFKSASTKAVHRNLDAPALMVWQRGFFEHIIRTEKALFQIRQYIVDNPIQWHVHRLNPQFETTG